MELPISDLFPTADRLAWLTQVGRELKDDNAYNSLRWPTPDGFVAEPYYTADELAQLPLVAMQSVQKQRPGWLNTPDLTVTSATESALLREILTQGADALVLHLASETDLTRLLNGIKLSDTPLFFQLGPHAPDPVTFVKALQRVAPYQLKGGILTANRPSLAEITRQTLNSPQFRTVCEGSHSFHNAGATASQEMAFLLAQLADTYDQLTDSGLTVRQLLSKTMLSVSVGTSYFMEIAKLRALRVLWERFCQAYGESTPAYVHVQTSTFYDAAATPYTNLLRATTEAMAAVVGGCDLLTVHPYDTVLAAPSAFSERIARNVSVLLKEESHLDKVADPSAGSYYIEQLTYELAEAAWALFLEVEARGGFSSAFESGFIPTAIGQAYQDKIEAVRNGKVLVGVTKFRFDETTAPALQPQHDPPGTPIGTGFTLPDRRLARAFEH